MNILSCPRFTVLHPADLKSGDSGAIETSKKHCMDPKARYTALATRLEGIILFPSIHEVHIRKYVE